MVKLGDIEITRKDVGIVLISALSGAVGGYILIDRGRKKASEYFERIGKEIREKIGYKSLESLEDRIAELEKTVYQKRKENE